MHSIVSPPCAELFLSGTISPEVAAFNAGMEAMLKDAPGLWDIGLEAGRRGDFMPMSPPSRFLVGPRFSPLGFTLGGRVWT